MRNLIILFAMILGLARVHAQEGPSPASGIGIIAPATGLQSMCLHFPAEELALWSAPGSKCGVIFKKDLINLMYITKGQSRALRVNSLDLAEVSAAGYCLKYYAVDNGFARVLDNTVGGGCWVDIRQLAPSGFTIQPWMDVLKARKNYLFVQVAVGLNLRSLPDPDSEKITLVRGRLFSIEITGETKGQWAGVHVSRYAKPPCPGKKQDNPVAGEWTGWMKIIDDAGYPNLWFDPRNCK
jgi:hypothetical protein